MSLWSEESGKEFSSAAALFESYNAPSFGAKIEYWENFHDRKADVLKFLLEHYDANAPSLIEFFYDRAVVRFALTSVQNGSIIAFMAGVPLPVKTPQFAGTACLGTLICVAPFLRKTGLVRNFLRANMRITAARGFAVRCSTTSTPIALSPTQETQRYIVYPQVKAKKDGLKFDTDRQRALDILIEHAPASGIDWANVDWPEDSKLLYYSCERDTDEVCAAVLLQVNPVSAQVLGCAATDTQLLASFFQYVASSRSQAVIVDATNPSSLHSDFIRAKNAVPDTVNPKYWLYFHNARVKHGECSIPWM